MEFLLVNHPLDCPICDQGGECDLQVCTARKFWLLDRDSVAVAVVGFMTIFPVQTYSSGLLTMIPYYVSQTVVVVAIVDWFILSSLIVCRMLQ